MRSRRTIDTGTVQYGLKLISMILLDSRATGRSGLPTTAVWRDTATPFSTASICAAGMLHDHEAVGQRNGGQAAQPHQIGPELGEPHRRGDVERLESLLAHDAVDADAVPGLEAAHRRPRHRNRRCRRRRHWARDRRPHQALAQRRHARMAVAQPQPVGGRHLRPAAARHDAVVFADRVFGVLHGRRRQRRQVGLRHVDGARGAVEIPADLALLVLLDQQPAASASSAAAARPHSAAARPPPRICKKAAAIGAAARPLGRLCHRRLDKRAEHSAARPKPCSCPGSARGGNCRGAIAGFTFALSAAAGDFVAERQQKSPGREGAGARCPTEDESTYWRMIFSENRFPSPNKSGTGFFAIMR